MCRRRSQSAARRLATALVTVFLAAFFVGCKEPGERPATWSYLHAAVVVPACATASCHSSLTARAGIVLEDADDAYDLLLGEQFVVPGDPQSALMFLLEGDERTPMPPDVPLPDADIDLFRAWIELGAERE